MNKNVIAVFAAVCGLFMVSCDTPKDLRPDNKVSNSTVEPGMRNTYNVSDAGGEATAHAGDHSETHVKEDEVMPNHDMGGNTIQKGDSVKEATLTNTEAGANKR
ncbi:hypothetical protein ABID22_001209 [Pontibacter aydingkolensis]|uniref:Lipoprotein n=1 Tax=Pontibacter aydingkolensis TaxID=1911536 RepID=A0ABS7CTK8_9BACT|nr:hypothetical protein [Pontibacter aydingkolensis]MBW7467115.1 hypothetical protein [Pontibacter aydingkolensis]